MPACSRHCRTGRFGGPPGYCRSIGCHCGSNMSSTCGRNAWSALHDERSLRVVHAVDAEVGGGLADLDSGERQRLQKIERLRELRLIGRNDERPRIAPHRVAQHRRAHGQIGPGAAAATAATAAADRQRARRCSAPSQPPAHRRSPSARRQSCSAWSSRCRCCRDRSSCAPCARN